MSDNDYRRILGQRHPIDNPEWFDYIFDDKMSQKPVFEVKHVDRPAQLTYTELVQRLLGTDNYVVQVREEVWGSVGIIILHVALLDKATKKIVRFEEDPIKFPSHEFIDKLRLLGC